MAVALSLVLFMGCNMIHLPFCSRVEKAVIRYAWLAAGRDLSQFLFGFVCVREQTFPSSVDGNAAGHHALTALSVGEFFPSKSHSNGPFVFFSLSVLGHHRAPAPHPGPKLKALEAPWH